MPPAPDRLRIALLAYRGNPLSGGQGVYVRHLSRELVRLGHEVSVFSGQPYPRLDEGVSFEPVPSLDLYREPDPFRTPRRDEFRDVIDVAEAALMRTGGYPEPLTFSLRALRALRARASRFDVVHDNQSLGYGLLGIARAGLPVVATVHHPITVDRRIAFAQPATPMQRLGMRRWFAFVRMQGRVARRVARVLTVSKAARWDIVRDFGVTPSRVAVVPVGVDPTLFRPRPDVARVPGRVMAIATADSPQKGIVHLLEAVAKLRTEGDVHLVVVGPLREDGPTAQAVERLGLGAAVRFISGIPQEEVVRLFAEAVVAVVPSLYEGFSLPAVEAMACGVPLVATTGGALPEVAGDAALLVPPGEAHALAAAIDRLLDDEGLRAHHADAGRARVLERFTWERTAAATAEQYRVVLARDLPC